MTEHVVLDRAGIDRLIETLSDRGYTVLGPTVSGAAITLGEISSTADLPVGVTDEQEAARYRLDERGDDALFGYVVGPTSPKNYLHPAEVVLWAGTSTDEGFVARELPEPPRFAFLGVRPCEVAAMAIQDRVFVNGSRDSVYGPRRDGSFVVAVNCTEPGGTCFCTSMGTGPKAREGFDLAITEVIDGTRHEFVVEAGSEAGAEVLADLGGTAAGEDLVGAAEALLAEAAGAMGRSLETDGLKDVLQGALESPQWKEIAARCLTCANCTMVCPTCFCATVEDVTDLTGTEAERVRRWDSCFNEEFSYIHGGPLRPSPYVVRYRQWLTHKLASWIDQFGTAGCVGCGRCITWCPVGIDITAEAAAIRSREETAHVGA